MKRSMDSIKQYLYEVVGCKLCSQITLTVFISILAIELIILIPSVVKEHRRLVSELDHRTENHVRALIAQHGAGLQLSRHLEQHQQEFISATGTNLIALQVVTNAEDTYSWFVSSTSPQTVADMFQQGENTNWRQKHIVFDWRFGIEGIDYAVYTALISNSIQAQVIGYVLRILGLIIIISLFVTVATSLILRNRVLKPLLALRNALQLVGDDPEHPEHASLPTPTPNELGDVVNFFNRLILKQYTLLTNLHLKEDALAKNNSQLESWVEERTEALQVANQSLLQEVEARKIAQKEVESIALFPMEDSSPVLRFSVEGQLLFANPASQKLPAVKELPEGGIVPKRWLSFFQKIIAAGKARKVIMRWKDSIYDVHFVPFPDKGYVNTYAADITREKHNEERANRLAYFDVNTGLPNRVQFFDLINQYGHLGHPAYQNLAIIHLDLEGFTNFNQVFGQENGDRILQICSERIVSAVHRFDKHCQECMGAPIGASTTITLSRGATIARMGADEFAILLRNHTAEETRELADSVEQLIRQPLTLKNQQITLDVALGIALHPNGHQEITDLFANALSATQEAKAQGKRVCVYSSKIGEHIQRRNRLSHDLKFAAENGELELHYQPKIGAVCESLHGAEALVRWNHPALGSISPGEFIPIAEQNGLMPVIGQWVLETALKQASIWQQEELADFEIAVNLSAQQFQDERLVQLVQETIRRSGVSPARVELELTESMLMVDQQKTIDLLSRLTDLGLKLAIDDFGTGYSSLSYLSRFPVDTLKIDRSFIKDLAHKADDRNIAKTIIQLAKTQNMKIVAEGVESREQLDLLLGWKCDLIQGYYYSKPLPGKEFYQWSQSHMQRTRSTMGQSA